MADENVMNPAPQGEPAPAPTPAPTPAPVSATPEASEPTFDPKDIADNKMIAALSYLSLLFLVPLLAKRESPFCQFHAKQGLVLAIIGIIGTFVFWIPVIGWLAAIFFFVVDIIGLVKALSGEAWKVPVVYDLSKKFNL